ncbi:hypothetical protein RchiOBHm_Chr2g0090081 [Rosa chinensis]|uniref:KRR1 small subunit processome component second KH domain-containing protein n=1 Tax=Rosa chinensis TaxID=74649 RepID=A0A2P6RJC4_ROSCH|nr:hypothetical protein RchiOBHm_Chr2g0090081 [Rosa chinensis]
MENQNIESMEMDKSGPSSSNDETSFSAFFSEKRQLKLQDVWPELESSLDAYGISCAINLPQRSVTISRTPTTKGRNYYDKAKSVVELLAITQVPPHLALEVLNGNWRFHTLIKTGNQEGGFCSKFGISPDQFAKRRDWLAGSLEAISALTLCHLYVNENTAAAVGSAASVLEFRRIVENCIVSDVNPAESNNKIKKFLSYKNHVLQKRGVDYTAVLEKSGMSEVTSFGAYVAKGLSRNKEVDQAWPFVESFLEQYGISCTLHRVLRSMTFSTTRVTKDPDVMDSVGALLEVLGSTSVPGSKVIQILDSRLQYEFIKTGFEKGGLCSKFDGIEKELAKNKQRLKRNAKNLGDLLVCDVYIDRSSVVVVGSCAAGLKEMRSIVERCLVKNEDPATAVRRLRSCNKKQGSLRLSDEKQVSLMKKLEGLCL